MRRLAFTLIVLFLLLPAHRSALAATATTQTVKDVALIFGQALVRNDGATALAMLSPTLRSQTAANQLPGMLGVVSPPQSVKVVRWAFNGSTGDATVSMGYAREPVAEHLYLHLYAVGWRIDRILPEDAVALQRAAETSVVAFCDAAVRHDATAMKKQLTDKYAAKHSSAAAILKLIPLAEPISGYSVVSFGGTPAGADVTVRLHSDTTSVLEHFAVINDRAGWRISAIDPA